MSKMICEQSFDGNISVNSQDNTTVFRIELPIKE
jgi:nitrogen-specific signal transduction histidine kinase